MSALYGLAETYGAFYHMDYHYAFQQMANLVARGQAGCDYSYEYLESTLLDLLYFFYIAARHPMDNVILPGQTQECTPADMPPAAWAQALVTGFESLLVKYRNVSIYQNFLFRRTNQPSYPAALAAKGKVALPILKDGALDGKGVDGKGVDGKGVDVKKVKGKGLCGANIIMNYKVKAIEGKGKKCGTDCPRLHVNKYPANQPRAQVLAVAAKICQPQLDAENYKKLVEAIEADKRFK
jgi:hypothetical protein